MTSFEPVTPAPPSGNPAPAAADSAAAAANELPRDIADRLKRTADGLVPAVVQEANTHEVLMLAWMNDLALARTLTTGRATYWSRSRDELWVKGETSGNVQEVVGVALDCDADTILLTVRQTGPACHTGTRTCFTGRELQLGAA